MHVCMCVCVGEGESGNFYRSQTKVLVLREGRFFISGSFAWKHEGKDFMTRS